MEVGQCGQRRTGRCYPVGLEMGDEAMSQGLQSFLEAVKGKNTDYFLEPPKVACNCSSAAHLGLFSHCLIPSLCGHVGLD